MILKELIKVMSKRIRIAIRILEHNEWEDVTTIYTGKIEEIPRKILAAYADYKVIDVVSPAEDFGYITEDSTEMSLDCDGSVKPSIDKKGRIIFTFNNTIAINIEE